MADLNALKQKYAPVITKIQQFADYGATVDAVDLAGEQLHVKASVPSQVVANRVWDEIKKVDPSFADLQHNITVGSGTLYVVKSGDNLSNISKSFYGNPNEYSKIAQANNISNPDRIQVGQQLKIPAA